MSPLNNIIIFFITIVYAKHHLSIILLSAPKKIPMLTYTIDYFLNAYNYNRGDIIIDGFFMGKGCDCEHVELYDVMNKLKNNGIPTYDVQLNKDVLYDDSEFMKKFYDFYSSAWNDNHQYYYEMIDHSYMKILITVTNFFHQLIDEMERITPKYEYILFLEDDVAFQKDFFVKLSEEMKKTYDDELLMKLAYYIDYKIPDTHWKLPRDGCVWGFWGMLYNREQLKQYKTFGKYQNFLLTGDLYHCEMYRMFNQSIRMVEIAYHFGRDKEINPRDKRFWMKQRTKSKRQKIFEIKIG